jgi:AcrR family transcriptional regulator
VTGEHTGPPAAPRRRGRPRSAAVELAITEGVLRLLEDGAGLADLTVERIARTAGVGKATIYRRWPGRDELLVDVLASLDEPAPEPAGDSVRDDLVRCGEAIRTRGRNRRTSAVLRMALTEARHHPKLARMYHDAVVEVRRDVLRRVLKRGIAAGEIRADLDVELLMELFAGPMLVRTVLRDCEPLEAGLSERIVDAVLDGVRASPPR